MNTLPDFTTYADSELADIANDRAASLTWRVAASDEQRARAARVTEPTRTRTTFLADLTPLDVIVHPLYGHMTVRSRRAMIEYGQPRRIVVEADCHGEPVVVIGPTNQLVRIVSVDR